MSLSEAFNNLSTGTYVAGAIIIALSLIQISPIKVNPWTWGAKKIRKILYGEIITKIDNVEIQVSGLRQEMGEDRVVNARVRILQFNDEMLSDQLHSKESFDQVLDDITYYEKYCEEHPDFRNNRTKMAVQNIERCYQKCLVDHDFL